MDADAVLRDFDLWLHRTAHTLLGSEPTHHDDVVQVGRIAMWRALQGYDPAKGALPSYVTTRARFEMVDAVRVLRRSEALISDSDIPDGPDVSSASRMEWVESGDTLAVVRAAVRSLTPAQRRYVVARFWLQRRYPELIRMYGYDPRGVWAGARKNLSRALSHLVAA